jgi:4'-phosphopantetheinyl transferase
MQGKMKIIVFDHIEECTAQEVERMLPLVSKERREQAMKYKHLLGQYCCLKSWILLEELIMYSTKPAHDKHLIMSENRKWEYNEYGKPFLPGGPYFSISHCKEGIAVAIDDQPIGIDIEAIRPVNNDLIERVMNEEERVGMNDRLFTRLWTQKEAVLKAEGTGIMSFEQMQSVLVNSPYRIETIEKEKYIYSVAYKS